jgi:hypothetical protein
MLSLPVSCGMETGERKGLGAPASPAAPLEGCAGQGGPGRTARQPAPKFRKPLNLLASLALARRRAWLYIPPLIFAQQQEGKGVRPACFSPAARGKRVALEE